MPVWWGVVVLTFGAVSSVLGVMYALAEHDIKRLLAYHTVENVGIILMGVGVGLMGLALKNPLLAALGFLGALYHLLNHAVFKGLLFLGAGAIIYKVHTKDMEKMGGLGKRMPRTALSFLVGCMAISALPPLNGFVSEWYTYQGLVSISQHSHERRSFLCLSTCNTFINVFIYHVPIGMIRCLIIIPLHLIGKRTQLRLMLRGDSSIIDDLTNSVSILKRNIRRHYDFVAI